MIRVHIGANERTLQDLDTTWINEQIGRRRGDDQPVCVRIHIEDGRVNVELTTLDCTHSSGASRPPNAQKKEIFSLWDKSGLNRTDFTATNLVEFVNQLTRLIGD